MLTSTRPKAAKWLRRQPPRFELALRNGDELLAILRHLHDDIGGPSPRPARASMIWVVLVPIYVRTPCGHEAKSAFVENHISH
jgi:hypothetical protein